MQALSKPFYNAFKATIVLLITASFESMTELWHNSPQKYENLVLHGRIVVDTPGAAQF